MSDKNFSIKEYLDVKFSGVDEKFKEINDSLSDIQKMKNDIHSLKIKVCAFNDHIDDHYDLVIRDVESYLYLDNEVGLAKLLDRLVHNKKLRERFRELSKELSNENTAVKVGILGGDIRISIRNILITIVTVCILVALGYKVKP